MRTSKETEFKAPNAYEQLHKEAFKSLSPDFSRAVTNFFSYACETPATLAESYLLKSLLEYLYHEAPDDEQNLFMTAELLEAGIILNDDEYNDDYSLHGFIRVKDDNKIPYSNVDRLYYMLKAKDPDHVALKHYQLFYQIAGIKANDIIVSCRKRFSAIGTKSNIFKYTMNTNDIKILSELMLTTYNSPRTYSLTDKLYDYLKKCYNTYQSGRKPVRATDLKYNLKEVEDWKTFYFESGDDDEEEEIVNEDDANVLAEKVGKEVLGQDDAIDNIAVVFSDHVRSKSLGKKTERKHSFLLVGSTGVGKTEILKHFSKICKIPFIDINTANLAPIGWRGINIGDYIRNYKNENRLTWKEMEYSVIFYDEFDKISPYVKKDVSEGSAATNWNFDIQRDIMQLYNTGKTIPIRTSTENSEILHNLPVDNLLICFSGAFSGVEDVIKRRKGIRGSFSTKENTEQEEVNYLKELKVEDLEKFGYMRELLGRIGKIEVLNPMTEDLLWRIMKETSGNAVSKNINDCKLLHNIDIRFSDEALRVIATLADKKLGARGIDPIINNMLHRVNLKPKKFRNRTLTIDEVYITDYLVNG
jgi:ATP-dependent Clp protease ATP-binding subunit ClpX